MDLAFKPTVSYIQGLQDLADGLIRTPLSAFKTFCDDPLRVLRCIRFASRFGFEIVDDIVQAVKDEKIKVSKLCNTSYQCSLGEANQF
jgi:tRNA nucleotidyltransferase/poly(A) polymerase